MASNISGKSMAEKTPIQVQFPDDELAAIDSYRRAQVNPPTRPQAIRNVLRNALSRRDNGDAGAIAQRA
jgi:hypothetical protein